MHYRIPGKGKASRGLASSFRSGRLLHSSAPPFLRSSAPSLRPSSPCTGSSTPPLVPSPPLYTASPLTQLRKFLSFPRKYLFDQNLRSKQRLTRWGLKTGQAATDYIISRRAVQSFPGLILEPLTAISPKHSPAAQ
jgi:hypothetical protein